MTSKQVMPTLMVLASLLLSGCSDTKKGAEPLVGPYPSRRVWAVVPLRNESGSLQIDGAVLADHFVRHLQNATNIQMLPVNRTLEAMDALRMKEVSALPDALKLMSTLEVDGLLVGTVTSYDPYDPPKLGLTIELFQNPHIEQSDPVDPHSLTHAATSNDHLPGQRLRQPLEVVSAFFDAADADTRHQVQRYAYDRGASNKKDTEWFENPLSGPDPTWREIRISTDLYCEFVTYVMSWRLLHAEALRLAPPPPIPGTGAGVPGAQTQPVR